MTQQWEVETSKGRCATTGKALEEGEEFYTVLFEAGESFTRADYCLEAWKGQPEGAFCYFKSRVPVKERRKQLLVNNDLLLGFFERLADESEPSRVHFRFVLALILMRKRILRYENTSIENGIETWRMTRPRDQSVHNVINPQLNDDQIDDVSKQLTAILHSDMGPWAGCTDAAEPGPPESQQERE